MQDSTLRVLEYNKIKELLSAQAVCADTRDMCNSLAPTDDIYEAKALLSLSDEAVSLIFKKGAPPISPVRNIVGAVMRSSAGGALGKIRNKLIRARQCAAACLAVLLSA